MNTPPVILPTHTGVPTAHETLVQPTLQECTFRMHLAPDDPQAPMVHIEGGVELTAGVWSLYGYFGSGSRQWFSIPISPDGEVAKVLAVVLEQRA